MSATNQPLPSRFGVARTHTHTHAHAQGKNLPLQRQRFFWAQKHKFSTQNSRRQNALKQSQCRQGSAEDIKKGTRQRETQGERDKDKQYRQYPKTVQHRHHHHHHHHLQSARPDQSRPNDYPSDTAESCPATFDCSSVVSFKRNTNAFGRRPAQIHKPNKISTNYSRE